MNQVTLFSEAMTAGKDNPIKKTLTFHLITIK